MVGPSWPVEQSMCHLRSVGVGSSGWRTWRHRSARKQPTCAPLRPLQPLQTKPWSRRSSGIDVGERGPEHRLAVAICCAQEKAHTARYTTAVCRQAGRWKRNG